MQPLSNEQLHQSYLDYEEDPRAIAPAPGSSRARRRTVAGGEHVKHRRTRSGCYTCRNRRVKCDETHPICERCRKGNRDCVYPEPTTSKSSRSNPKSKSSPQESVSSAEEFEHDGKEPLPSIPDDDEDAVDAPLAGVLGSQSRREASDTPSLTHDRSPSPSTEGSTTLTNPQSRPSISRSTSMQAQTVSKQAAKQSIGRPSPELPQDVKFYLHYHRTHMSYHHYCFKRDQENFLRTTFLELAVKNEPLLYAVVGFAAYYHTLTKPDGRIQDFLRYYNKSVQLLRLSIQRSKRHNLATLLTILQLASIEELLGDWVNLMGHQKAAYELLTTLYTPHTIMQNETLRKILLWYIRFDLFVGFQSASETVLGREWFNVCHDYYVQQLRTNPHDLTLKYEERFAYSRLLATDVAILFSRKSKGLMSDEVFATELADIDRRFSCFERDIDPILLDPSAQVKDFTGAPPRQPSEIVNPYEPGLLYSGDLWTTNYLLLDFWSIDIMYKLQLTMVQRRPPPPELIHRAYRTCQLFEAIELYPGAPPGAVIEAQASFGIATLFLPKDERHVNWFRRTFARIETLGYIYPATFRTRMTEEWGVDVTRWWFPNDEGCPPIIRSIKDFIEDRTTVPRDQTSEDLRDMKGLFSSLSIADSPDRGSPPSGLEGSQELPLGGTPAGSASLDSTLIYGGSPDYGWNYEQEGYPAPEQFSGSDHFPGQ
ncbi:hypothetical protein AOQ84DRAFT_303910 [Glonium stellatum]|uniref:Zn(2)-C6 fungal-type domain-containing protein n=1 Tax=Glonium stellatum TaxID=574774 RepID=A0A8E2JN52_9PEZI|nr:hypothetical protein AOQ84DRAFT_303910 [Glonium stellatum]